jgi:hypothetical protein
MRRKIVEGFRFSRSTVAVREDRPGTQLQMLITLKTANSFDREIANRGHGFDA